MANALSAPLRAAGARVPELRAALTSGPDPHRSPVGAAGGTCTARCCRRTPTRPTGSPTACSPPGGGGRDAGRAARAHPGGAPPDHRRAGPGAQPDPGDRGGAAGARPAGRGGRPGRPAGHPRGTRRGLHAAGARRPDRRRRAAAAAHRRPLADRAARPGGAAPAGPGHRRAPGDRLAADDEPGDQPRTGWTRRPWSRRWPTSGRRSAYSAEGYARLRAYGRELALLRYRLDQPLPDLVADIERTIGLDVEVAVRAGRDGAGDAGLARGHLDALGDVAARFARDATAATLSGVPGLPGRGRGRGARPGAGRGRGGRGRGAGPHRARRQGPGVGRRRGGRAEPRACGRGRSATPTTGWAGSGVLPFPLRGDADGLPVLDLAEAADQQGVARAVTDFTDAWRAHDEREERRLAYVAVTRPRRLLLCSGYWWGEGTKRPRGPSVFLREVHDACLAGGPGAGRRVGAGAGRATRRTRPPRWCCAREWPADPLGGRRPALAEAAALVRRLLADGPAAALPGPVAAGGRRRDRSRRSSRPSRTTDPEVARWQREADLLLAERAELTRRSGAVEVALPGAPVGHPAGRAAPRPGGAGPYAAPADARRAQPVRPPGHRVPRLAGAALRRRPAARPGRAARRGRRGRRARRGAGRACRSAFLASEWADRTPVEVEVPFATVIAGVVVRGRMDAVFARPGRPVRRGRLEDRPAADRADGRRRPRCSSRSYRLAWAELAGVPVDRVGRGVPLRPATGVTVRPADLLDADGLTAMIAGVARRFRPSLTSGESRGSVVRVAVLVTRDSVCAWRDCGPRRSLLCPEFSGRGDQKRQAIRASPRGALLFGPATSAGPTFRQGDETHGYWHREVVQR